jgi:hypothetical protein
MATTRRHKDFAGYTMTGTSQLYGTSAGVGNTSSSIKFIYFQRGDYASFVIFSYLSLASLFLN